MRVLIVMATAGEAQGITRIDPAVTPGTLISVNAGTDLMITGIGQALTAYHLGGHLAGKTYDLAVNAGICGSFNNHIPLGEVVKVVTDRFADLGAEDDEKWIDVFDMGLAESNIFPFSEGKLQPQQNDFFNGLRTVNGITVNRGSGNDASVKKLISLFNADIESMEGAAFFYACMLHRIPAVQVRAVSNYIEKRNRAAWQIEKAVTALHVAVLKELHL
jgi:futalosine hydrolase